MEEDSSLQDQADELLALQSIYDSNEDELIDSTEVITVEIINDNAHDGASSALNIHLIDTITGLKLVIQAALPLDYPISPPVIQINADDLSFDEITSLATALDEVFIPGQVVLFSYIELVRERWREMKPPPLEMPQAINNDFEQLALADNEVVEEQHVEMIEISERIIHGEPFTVSKSTFQAHLCHVNKPDQVKLFVEILLENNKIRQATHNIMAYRIERSDCPGSWIQDCDDDGEQAAGGRLLHLLEMTNVKNVAVVVSRWFGGILLGPSRFGHINNIARQLLAQEEYINNDKKGDNKGPQSHRSTKKK